VLASCPVHRGRGSIALMHQSECKQNGLLNRFLRDERGAAASLEFAMLSIPAILIVLAVVQTIMLARAMVVLEHAAYAAARSALVHHCRPVAPFEGEENLFSLGAEVWGNLNCSTDDATAEVQAVVLRAAQLAVIPISASNGDARARRPQCDYPEGLVDFVIGAGVRPGLRDAVAEQACYAFEPGNVEVEFRWTSPLDLVLDGGLAQTIGDTFTVYALPPIEATVRFKMPVFVPVQGIFSDGRRNADGTHYRNIEATVTLL